jgi:hypothetical protein
MDKDIQKEKVRKYLEKKKKLEKENLIKEQEEYKKK